MSSKNNKGMVSVIVLKPFHTGIDKPTPYTPGDKSVELPEQVAKKAIAQGLAKEV